MTNSCCWHVMDCLMSSLRRRLWSLWKRTSKRRVTLRSVVKLWPMMPLITVILGIMCQWSSSSWTSGIKCENPSSETSIKGNFDLIVISIFSLMASFSLFIFYPLEDLIKAMNFYPTTIIINLTFKAHFVSIYISNWNLSCLSYPSISCTQQLTKSVGQAVYCHTNLNTSTIHDLHLFTLFYIYDSIIMLINLEMVDFHCFLDMVLEQNTENVIISSSQYTIYFC